MTYPLDPATGLPKLDNAQEWWVGSHDGFYIIGVVNIDGMTGERILSDESVVLTKFAGQPIDSVSDVTQTVIRQGAELVMYQRDLRERTRQQEALHGRLLGYYPPNRLEF